MAKAFDPVAEAEHKAKMSEIAYNAMLGLRDTLNPKFNAEECGYINADDARRTIVKYAVIEMDKLTAAHLRKYG